MKSDKRTEKRKLGDTGESIACNFLKRRGFDILDRNYLKKWGEIDIIAKKKGVIRFIEVKTVSRVTLNDEVTQETYRPEDNLHPWKLKRLSRAIQTFLLERDIKGDWQFDVVTVRIDESHRRARVEIIENIII